MKKSIKKKKTTSRFKKFLKKLFMEHLNCTVWAAMGIYVLVSGKTGRPQYFITWALLIMVMWRYMPDKKRPDIIDIAKMYPIGSKVRLTCDMPDYEPRIVQGYKQVSNTIYLIFSDGNAACVERIENVRKCKR